MPSKRIARSRTELLIQEIRQAIPAIRDRALIEAKSTMVKVTVRPVLELDLEGQKTDW